MFTEQILKSILSLKAFSAGTRAHTPPLEGIHISVDGVAKTITALATDRCAAARMVVSVPEYTGESWERNVPLATLNAALAAVKAGSPVSVFPEAYMPEFPASVNGLIDNIVLYEKSVDIADFNAKYFGALAKINVGGDKSGRWTIRTVAHGGKVHAENAIMSATATYGSYEVTVVVMSLRTQN
jgi:hypothetical protein